MKWDKPIEMKDELPFGPANVYDIMPARADIPEKFGHCSSNEWCKWQSQWFFSGLKDNEIPVCKKGIDTNTAISHLAMIQRSWQPKHEHKQEAIAYLASLWFKKCPKLNKGK